MPFPQLIVPLFSQVLKLENCVWRHSVDLSGLTRLALKNPRKAVIDRTFLARLGANCRQLKCVTKRRIFVDH